MHVIFVYFVCGDFLTKIKGMRKVKSKSENPHQSATVRKFHAYERLEMPGYENWVHTKYSGFTVFSAGVLEDSTTVLLLQARGREVLNAGWLRPASVVVGAVAFPVCANSSSDVDEDSAGWFGFSEDVADVEDTVSYAFPCGCPRHCPCGRWYWQEQYLSWRWRASQRCSLLDQNHGRHVSHIARTASWSLCVHFLRLGVRFFSCPRCRRSSTFWPQRQCKTLSRTPIGWVFVDVWRSVLARARQRWSLRARELTMSHLRSQRRKSRMIFYFHYYFINRVSSFFFIQNFFYHYYRKRGSASYIVCEVREVRERDTERERERERERVSETEVTSP